jgi:hypothetical protein
MKTNSRKRKEREKWDKGMKRKKTQMKKDRLDMMKDRQLLRLLEESSDEWLWKKIPDKRSSGQIEKPQVEFYKKGSDNVKWNKKYGPSHNMMKKVKLLIY